MGQCLGYSKTTSERCRRSAAAGALTCAYHVERAERPERDRATNDTARPPHRRFTTKLLSRRTLDDFETLFAPGTGWGRCACLFALDAPRSTRGGTWAEQRETNLRTMGGLVGQRRAQGVLVYDGDRPVGWCQFVPSEELRFSDIAASGADWYITCFVVDPRYRGLGVTRVALRAATKAISRRGGGVVEASAVMLAPGPPPAAERRDLYEADGVLFWGGVARVRYGVEVEGVGPVAALYRTRRSMHGAPLGGTVDLFRREGFAPAGVRPRPASALVDRVVMRRTLPGG